MNKNIRVLFSLILCSFLGSAAAFAAKGDMDGIVKFFFDNGKKAYSEKHYNDAVGWFERADAAAGRFVWKDEVLGGICQEWLGRGWFMQKNYDKTVRYLESAQVKFKSANNGGEDPNSTRVWDLLAECYFKKGDFEREEGCLVAALRGGLGTNPTIVAEPNTIPYRTERVAQFCRDHGGLSVQIQFQGATNVGRTANEMYANSINDLAAKDKANGSQNGVKEAITKLFQLWKLHNDNGGTEQDRVFYQTCWEQVYGSTTAGSGGQAYPTSTFVPGTGGWSFGQGGGLMFQPPPNTIRRLDGIGGQTPVTSPGGLWNSGNSMNNPNPGSAKNGTSTFLIPSSGNDLYKSPFRQSQQSRVFDGGEQESMQVLDEKIKKLLEH